MKIFLSFLFLSLCALGAMPAAVAGPSTCSEIIAERNTTFDNNKLYLQRISSLRGEITVLENRAELLSGGALEDSKAKLADRQASLKRVQTAQEQLARRLKELDAQVQQCKNGRHESAGGTWTGKWRGGNRDYDVFSMTGKVFFNLTSPDHTITGQGGCTPSGSSATCDYQERYKSGAEAADSFGTMVLIFNGDTILEKRTLTGVQCHGGGQDWCDAFRARIGQTVEDTWYRVKP